MGRQAGGGAAGRLGFDPAARRRVRRTAARLRPLLLPAAVVVAAAVAVGALAPAPPPAGAAQAAAQVPEGRVLVAVQPHDPAVLALAAPGSLVDVYAAPAWTDPSGEDAAGPAERVVDAAPVLPGSAGGPAGPLPPGGPLAATGAGPSAALTLAVTDAEAAALAARTGGPLLVAVRGSPAAPSPPGG